MTKRYLKFFYYYLLTIFLFCTCCYIHAKLTNYFYQKKTHTIKTYSTQELKDKWLTKQPELIVQNINVESFNDIPKNMKLLGVNGVSISSTNPSYNSNYSNCIIWNLKNPQDGLFDIYFKPRSNPFKIKYPCDHNKYTFDDLLKQEIAIEKAYVFWDINKAQIDPNVNIHTINLKYNSAQEDNILNSYYQNWLNQCEIKKDKKTLAVDDHYDLYSNEKNAQKYYSNQIYYAPQPFQVEVKPYDRSKMYEDQEIDAIKNTKIFESQKTKINGKVVYYIKFNMSNYLDYIKQINLNGDVIKWLTDFYCRDYLKKIEMKFSHDVSLTPPQIDTTTKEAALQKYLTEIIETKDRYIELGCYNTFPDDSIAIPFNSNGYFFYNANKIENVYFDDGVRVFTNCDEANTLLKHTNGAKNIYLFQFEDNKFKIFNYFNNEIITPNYNFFINLIKNWSIDEYNKHGKVIKRTGKHTDIQGIIIQITDYTENDQIIKETYYYDKGIINKRERIIGHEFEEHNRQYDTKTIWAIAEYNENEKLVKKTHYHSYPKIQAIEEFNPNNGKKIKEEYYGSNGEIGYISEYNFNGQETKSTHYNDNGQTITQINEYNKNEKLIKRTYYRPDKTIKSIGEYNENKQLIKKTYYNPNGQTIWQIDEFNENNQISDCLNDHSENYRLFRRTIYNPDGLTIKAIQEYDKYGQIIKQIVYLSNNKFLKKITNYCSNYQHFKNTQEYNENEKLIKQTNYDYDGETISLIDEYNENEKLIKKIKYGYGGVIDNIQEYNENSQNIKTTHYRYCNDKIIDCISINEYNENEKLVKSTNYQDDGKTILAIEEYNENGNLIKQTNYNPDDQTVSAILEYTPDGTIIDKRTITSEWIKKIKDLGIVDDMQFETLKWIQNNIQGEIISNDENWGNCIIKSSDTYNNYIYTINCRLKQEKTEIIDLGPVNNKQTAIEERIKNIKKWNKHIPSFKITHNNENWGSCTVKATDSNYNYTYIINCCSKQEKTETIDLGPVDNMQTTTEEWIKNNVQGEITSNDKCWGNCYVQSTDSNYNYLYKIKCSLKEKIIIPPIDLGPVDNKQTATEEWIKNNVQGTITFNNKNWGNCWVDSTDSNRIYKYTIQCRKQQKHYDHFSKNIQFIDEFNINGQKTKTTHYNSNGQKTKEINYFSYDKINYINEYNKNEKLIKQTNYDYDGKTISSIEEYNEDEKLVKRIKYYYRYNGIDYIKEFDKNRNLIKRIEYRYDGQTIDYINEYNENEKLVKKTNYWSDGKTITQINEYNENEKVITVKLYQKDGKTITQIDEYNENEKLLKKTEYYVDGKTIMFMNEYNENEKLIKAKFYQDDGKTISSINEYNPNDQETKTTYYDLNGKTIDLIREYNSDRSFKETHYNPDETIKDIKEFNPDGSIKK